MAKNCDQCGVTIPSGEEQQNNSQLLCEDCYMDTLSPTRICDPWAVRHAKSCSESESTLTDIQKKLIQILTETGGIEMPELTKKLGLTEKETERNLANLRHMEKIKARPENGKKVFCLWSWKK